MASDRFDPTTSVPPEHIERVGEQMRDTTELDNLKDETMRNLRGEHVTVPWRTGRPLRSGGMTEHGTPLTPLAALDLAATVPPAFSDRLNREFQRVATIDQISEGVLDHAELQGKPLVEEEQWWEAEQRREREMAQQLAATASPVPCIQEVHDACGCDQPAPTPESQHEG